MRTRHPHRRYLAVLFSLAASAGILVSLLIAAPPDPPYKYWNGKNDPEWTSLTNHLTWCYNALVERYKAIGLGTNYIHQPTFVYPFDDYVQFAANVDFLSRYYVCHTNADMDGTFGAWFARTNREAWIMCWGTNDTYRSRVGVNPWVWSNVSFTYTPLPMFTNSLLHTTCGFTNWSTNVICRSWSIVTNRALVTQVQAAIMNLKWTFVVAPYSNNVSRWHGTNYAYQTTHRGYPSPDEDYVTGPSYGNRTEHMPHDLSEHDDVFIAFDADPDVLTSNTFVKEGHVQQCRPRKCLYGRCVCEWWQNCATDCPIAGRQRCLGRPQSRRDADFLRIA